MLKRNDISWEKASSRREREWIAHTGGVPEVDHGFGVSIGVSNHDQNRSQVEASRC
jgi:hypothetical protein